MSGACVSLFRACSADIPAAGERAIVRERDAETFYVQRAPRGYIVRNRTCINGGSRVVRTFDDVKQLIRRIP